MKVIGITGGVGSGKSLILNYIKEHYNCEIIMADDLAKDLCKSGELCYKPLVKLLGKEVLKDDKEIDRSVMAKMIFENDDIRAKVNGIIHPGVKKFILQRIAYLRRKKTKDYLFIEAALLIEDGYKDIVDELWYIYTDESVRRKRLKESRGYTDQKIDDIMASQLSEEEFRLNSDFEIDNSGDSEVSFSKIRERLGKTNEQ
ncbi:MAG: dephospho-CoA kinase [Lachnospiraceae bacterium]|nr:dephospho-CoA kinase [Lachnospiraceae bacterium]